MDGDWRSRPASPNKERRGPGGPRLSSYDCAAYLPHPEQEAQQSAEGQHDVFAAFTAPAGSLAAHHFLEFFGVASAYRWDLCGGGLQFAEIVRRKFDVRGSEVFFEAM